VFVELDTRQNEGYTVSLGWNRDTGNTRIVVATARVDRNVITSDPSTMQTVSPASSQAGKAVPRCQRERRVLVLSVGDRLEAHPLGTETPLGAQTGDKRTQFADIDPPRSLTRTR
jgi:hypothetical protein